MHYKNRGVCGEFKLLDCCLSDNVVFFKRLRLQSAKMVQDKENQMNVHVSKVFVSNFTFYNPYLKCLFLDDNLSDVKQCKIAETSTIATEFKACKTAFSDCKKLEDAVGPLVIKGMCGTATTTGAPRLRRKWLFDKLRV